MKQLKVFDDQDLANSLTLGQGLNGDPDYPYPAIASVAPVRATVSFEVEWSGIVATEQIHNSAQTFMGSFLSTGATINWSADGPASISSRRPPTLRGTWFLCSNKSKTVCSLCRLNRSRVVHLAAAPLEVSRSVRWLRDYHQQSRSEIGGGKRIYQ
jgi:hypothetical protein